MSDNKFDADGVLVTDQNYEGETRGFDDLSDNERSTHLGAQRDEVKKLDSIISRKGSKVESLNAIIKDEELDDEGKPKPEVPDVNQAGDSSRMDRLELAQEGYPAEVVEHIMSLGGKDALQNPIIKQSADAMAKQHNAVNAADIQSGPQSAVDKKYTQDDLDNMTADELAKVLPHAQ